MNVLCSSTFSPSRGCDKIDLKSEHTLVYLSIYLYILHTSTLRKTFCLYHVWYLRTFIQRFVLIMYALLSLLNARIHTAHWGGDMVQMRWISHHPKLIDKDCQNKSLKMSNHIIWLGITINPDTPGLHLYTAQIRKWVPWGTQTMCVLKIISVTYW